MREARSIFVCILLLGKKTKLCKDKRSRAKSEKEGRGSKKLLRSRSYPGFSIGILLSGKMNLPVNSVFIPLLNEIHRSMERERERGGREGHDREKRKHPPPPYSSFSPWIYNSE